VKKCLERGKNGKRLIMITGLLLKPSLDNNINNAEGILRRK
jgi:hypothetical protein